MAVRPFVELAALTGGDLETSEGTIRFADAIFLVNPAFSAIEMMPLSRTSAPGMQDQSPLVIVASETDHVTQRTYPMAFGVPVRVPNPSPSSVRDNQFGLFTALMLSISKSGSWVTMSY